MRLLVAMEPRAYREAIGTFLRSVRGRLEVRIVEPDVLEAEMALSAPDLVFSSLPNPSASEWPAWLEFHPGGFGQSVTFDLDGESSEVYDADLGDLLSIVDRTERSRAASTSRDAR